MSNSLLSSGRPNANQQFVIENIDRHHSDLAFCHALSVHYSLCERYVICKRLSFPRPHSGRGPESSAANSQPTPPRDAFGNHRRSFGCKFQHLKKFVMDGDGKHVADGFNIGEWAGPVS